MTVEIVATDSLRLHPLLAQMPDPESELMTSMANDIVERGIDDALIVDEKNRVMNGRIRLKVALAIDLAEVPIKRASSADAATIIVQSLLQRRHHSKSALAYLAYPLFEAMVVESRHRRVGNLIPNAANVQVPQKLDSTQNVLSSGSAEGIARQAGVSRALFFQAKEVHKLFAKHPEAKKILEPEILSGELCLGYAINGVAGYVATQQGRNSGQSGADQLDLFHRGINALRVRFSRWDKLSPKMRLLVANEFAEAVAEAPEEVQVRVLAALKSRLTKGAR
jgi:hypothetical protein